MFAVSLAICTEPLMAEVRMKSLDVPGCCELVWNEWLNDVLQRLTIDAMLIYSLNGERVDRYKVKDSKKPNR